jgi:hypothetical protein
VWGVHRYVGRAVFTSEHDVNADTDDRDSRA